MTTHRENELKELAQRDYALFNEMLRWMEANAPGDLEQLLRVHCPRATILAASTLDAEDHFDEDPAYNITLLCHPPRGLH